MNMFPLENIIPWLRDTETLVPVSVLGVETGKAAGASFVLDSMDG